MWIENFDGQCLRIRERPKVKVGHVAVGISEQVREQAQPEASAPSSECCTVEPRGCLTSSRPMCVPLQISETPFSLEALDGQAVFHDEEVQDPGLSLRCTPAPDGSPSWQWRVREGRLEVRD